MTDLGALNADFLADAARSGLDTREQRRPLAHVAASDRGLYKIDAIRGRHVQELRAAGVSECATGRIRATSCGLRSSVQSRRTGRG